MLLRKIKLGFRTFSNLALAEFSELVAKSMANNKYYPKPDPDLDVLKRGAKALRDQIVVAEQLRNDADAATRKVETLRKKLEGNIRDEAMYVECTNSDPGAIQTAGFKLCAKPGGKPHPVSIPDALKATSKFECAIDLKWQPVRHAKSYAVEMATKLDNTTADWSLCDIPTRSNFTLKDLKSGQRYWFRVAAVGAAGQSEWTGPVSRVAL